VKVFFTSGGFSLKGTGEGDGIGSAGEVTMSSGGRTPAKSVADNVGTRFEMDAVTPSTALAALEAGDSRQLCRSPAGRGILPSSASSEEAGVLSFTSSRDAAVGCIFLLFSGGGGLEGEEK
jgi:hypothetical protein